MDRVLRSCCWTPGPRGGNRCIVVARHTQDYIESRIRSGVLETVTIDLLHRPGIDAGLNAHGTMEEDFDLANGENLIRIEINAEVMGGLDRAKVRTFLERRLASRRAS